LNFLLRRRLIRRGEDKTGAIFDVGQDPVEAVCPQRAIAAAGAHVVDNEQVFLFAEELGETYLASGG
jgi:hypothetical protein